MVTVAEILTSRQIEIFHDQGFVVLSKHFPEVELRRLDKAILRHVKVAPAGAKCYPAPESQFTVIGNAVADPDLAFLAEHETMVGAVAQLLEAPPVLSAFVAYLKTPGATGTPGDYEHASATAHCDYKPYHQAGSSLRWLFAIVPLVDLDEPTGPLLVAPGSHKLTRIGEVSHGVRRITRASAKDIAPLVDTNLRRGDLLLMHGFTWHEGGPNRSDHDRYGIYNKYRAAHAPPAAGPNLFSNRAHAAFSGPGKLLLPHHSDKKIERCRLILEHKERILLHRPSDTAPWSLPGGAIDMADRARGADEGNVIASLEDSVANSIGLDLPWATFVGDYDEGNALCRIYAHVAEETPHVEPATGSQAQWFTTEQVLRMGDDLSCGFESDALGRWHDKRVIRGIGQSKRRVASGRA